MGRGTSTRQRCSPRPPPRPGRRRRGALTVARPRPALAASSSSTRSGHATSTVADLDRAQRALLAIPRDRAAPRTRRVRHFDQGWRPHCARSPRPAARPGQGTQRRPPPTLSGAQRGPELAARRVRHSEQVAGATAAPLVIRRRLMGLRGRRSPPVSQKIRIVSRRLRTGVLVILWALAHRCRTRIL
jgi:hypothetical protein